MSIVVGDTATILTTFRNTNGQLADPNTVTAQIQAPDGTTTTPTPTNQSLGVWATTVAVDQAGIWFYEVTGVGDLVDVTDLGSFCVQQGILVGS